MCAGGGGGGAPNPNTQTEGTPKTHVTSDQERYSDHWNSETGSWNYETKPGYTRDDSKAQGTPGPGSTFDRDTGYTYEKGTGTFEDDKLNFYKENVWNAPDTGGRSSGEMNV